MALLNSTYSLQQGFYTAGVFPAPISNYSGLSLVGLRMQPNFGALSTATMGQLSAFPGGSAAAVAAAASFSMEHLRAAHCLRPMATNGDLSPGGYGEKRSGGVTDFSIDGILGRRDIDDHDHAASPHDTIKVKHKLRVHGKHGATYQEKTFSMSKDCLDDQEINAAKMTDDEEGPDLKQDGDMSENPMARFSWLQCTRYKPPRLPRTKRKDGAKKRKLGRNPRVPFSPTQVATLEQKFRCTHYLSSIDVAELSAALNLSENRVKIWFQNRRARERRDKEGVDTKSQSSSTPNNLLPPSPASLSHSPHTPISPISSSPSSSCPSASPSSSSSSSSIVSMSPFASSAVGVSMMLPHLASPRTSMEGLPPLQIPAGMPPSSSHLSGLVAERSPVPVGQLSHHHLSLPSSEPSAGSAFTPVSPSLK